MSATFSTQIKRLKNMYMLGLVLRDVAESGEAGLRIVRTFALDYAERVLPAYEAKYPGDLRVRAAIEVSRRYLSGAATIDEVRAAAIAADDAAADAAADAASAAADAAAEAAANDAPNAAYVAARAADAAAYAADAAYAAAEAAANDAPNAAYVAARAAANAAERRWQRAHLIKLLEAAE